MLIERKGKSYNVVDGGNIVYSFHSVYVRRLGEMQNIGKALAELAKDYERAVEDNAHYTVFKDLELYLHDVMHKYMTEYYNRNPLWTWHEASVEAHTVVTGLTLGDTYKEKCQAILNIPELCNVKF